MASGSGLSVEQQQEIFVAVLQQLPVEQQQVFVEQLQALSAAEREQLALSILEQQQAQSAPPQTAQPEPVPSSSGLSAEQQQEIFVAVLQQLPVEQQQVFVEQLQALSAAEREQLALSILEQQQAQP